MKKRTSLLILGFFITLISFDASADLQLIKKTGYSKLYAHWLTSASSCSIRFNPAREEARAQAKKEARGKVLWVCSEMNGKKFHFLTIKSTCGCYHDTAYTEHRCVATAKGICKTEDDVE